MKSDPAVEAKGIPEENDTSEVLKEVRRRGMMAEGEEASAGRSAGGESAGEESAGKKPPGWTVLAARALEAANTVPEDMDRTELSPKQQILSGNGLPDHYRI